MNKIIHSCLIVFSCLLFFQQDGFSQVKKKESVSADFDCRRSGIATDPITYGWTPEFSPVGPNVQVADPLMGDWTSNDLFKTSNGSTVIL